MTPEVRFSAIEKNPQMDATPFTEKYPPRYGLLLAHLLKHL